MVHRYWLDGPDASLCELTVRGTYVWDEPTGTFRWHR
jgi:hypothetical protein